MKISIFLTLVITAPCLRGFTTHPVRLDNDGIVASTMSAYQTDDRIDTIIRQDLPDTVIDTLHGGRHNGTRVTACRISGRIAASFFASWGGLRRIRRLGKYWSISTAFCRKTRPTPSRAMLTSKDIVYIIPAMIEAQATLCSTLTIKRTTTSTFGIRRKVPTATLS